MKSSFFSLCHFLYFSAVFFLSCGFLGIHCIGFCLFHSNSVQSYVHFFNLWVHCLNVELFSFHFLFLFSFFELLLQLADAAFTRAQTFTLNSTVLIIACAVFYALYWFVGWRSSIRDLIGQYQTLLQSVKPFKRKLSNFSQNEICTSVYSYYGLGATNSVCIVATCRRGMY